MKRKVVILFSIFLFLFILRTPIFWACIKYVESGERALFPITNIDLLTKIESKSIDHNWSIEDIIAHANFITSETLQFSFEKAYSNPNQTFVSMEANCVGYAAMFHSIVNHLIIANHLEHSFTSHHCIGKIYLFGFDLHNLSDNTFFKDHDFNVVKNLETGEKISVDASVKDYLWIERVRN